MFTFEGCCYSVRALPDIAGCHMPNLKPGLRGKPTADIWICHRGQRMVLHAALAEQLVINEQMSLIDRTSGARKGRADDDLVGIERLCQCVANRADIAFGGRIKGRAVFEQKLLAALFFQPVQSIQRKSDRIGHGN